MTYDCGVRVAGAGSAAPPGILTNQDLEKMVDTSDEWIVQRTGIHRRHIIDPTCESKFTLARDSLARALEDAKMEASELDLIIHASVTSEMSCPSNALRIAGALGAGTAAGFDLAAACSGFSYGMNIADSLIRSGRHRKIGVIGCDALSTACDYTERSVSILFGDGAGAVVLVRDDDPEIGCIHQRLGGDGARWDTLYMTKFRTVIQEAMAETGLTVDDVKHFVCHQSNLRILEAAKDKLGIPDEKLRINIQEYGNTSAGSVGLVFDELWREGKIERGDIVLIVAFGGGLTWASSVWRI